MALAQKLALRQGQSLVMTPQLSQSIKLLALSNIELLAFVEAEIERNPLLELEQVEDSAGREKEPVETDGNLIAELTSHTELETNVGTLSENLGTSLENEFPDEAVYRKSLQGNSISREDSTIVQSNNGLQVSGNASVHDRSVADLTANRETLQEVLIGQLGIAGAPLHIGQIATNPMRFQALNDL